MDRASLRRAAKTHWFSIAIILAVYLSTSLVACGEGSRDESVEATLEPSDSTEALPQDMSDSAALRPSNNSTDLSDVEADRAALTALYHSTDGANWANNTNWLSEQPMGMWYGVTVNTGGRITHLMLSMNELSGELPSDLGSLDKLELLNLSWNQLLGQLPRELGNLHKLKRLYLEGNRFTGQIPHELGNLEDLTILHLFGNKLSGRIPRTLSNLPNLTMLHLYGNRLSGQVPRDLFGDIGSLIWLNLDGNALTGCLPSTLQDQLTGALFERRGLPFCDEVPPLRPCTAGMILKPGEYCNTPRLDTLAHPAWPYLFEVFEGYACIGFCSGHDVGRDEFSASRNSDGSWTVHSAPKGTAAAPVPAPSWNSNFGGLSLGPNDNSIVNIHMVNPSQEEAEVLAKQELDSTVWSNIREVRSFEIKYSKYQLDRWSNILTNYMRGPESFQLTSGGVDITENKVTLGVQCGAELEIAETLLRERMKLHNIPQDAVVFEVRHQSRLLPKPGPPYAFECLPREVVDPATGLSSPGFGGFFTKSGIIYVYMLEPSISVARELAQAYFGRGAVETRKEVRAVQGQFTWEQLLGWYTLILNENWSVVSGIFPCDIDAHLNQITIEVRRSANPDVIEELDEWLSDLEIPIGAINLVDPDLNE